SSGRGYAGPGCVRRLMPAVPRPAQVRSAHRLTLPRLHLLGREHVRDLRHGDHAGPDQPEATVAERHDAVAPRESAQVVEALAGTHGLANRGVDRKELDDRDAPAGAVPAAVLATGA